MHGTMPDAPDAPDTTPLQFRTLCESDYDDAVALWRATPGIGLGESDERAPYVAFLARNPGLSLCVWSSGSLVATVLCGHDGRRGYLHHLVVRPGHRNRGIGRTLVERCLRSLGDLGIPKCNIFLFSDNESGRAFWRRVRFAPRTDLLTMQRLTRG